MGDSERGRGAGTRRWRMESLPPDPQPSGLFVAGSAGRKAPPPSHPLPRSPVTPAEWREREGEGFWKRRAGTRRRHYQIRRPHGSSSPDPPGEKCHRKANPPLPPRDASCRQATPSPVAP
uniref:Uncharacterized protein n=1 Tax=Oryza meridionalis TaxID=40149 RepID=A0A0E0D5Q5_9ORYZ